MIKEIGILLILSSIAFASAFILYANPFSQDTEQLSFLTCSASDGSSVHYELERNGISARCTLPSGKHFTSEAIELKEQTGQDLLPFFQVTSGYIHVDTFPSDDKSVALEIYNNENSINKSTNNINLQQNITMNWNELSLIGLYGNPDSSHLGIQRIEALPDNEIKIVTESTTEPQSCTDRTKRAPYAVIVVPDLTEYQVSKENYRVIVDECK